MGRATSLSLGLLAVTACGNSVAEPRPQWFLTIGSEAPVPAVFNRLQVDVIDADGDVCDACRRHFGLSTRDDLPLSFGIAATDDGELRLRARLFRAERLADDGSPEARWTIDQLGALPAASAVTDVAMVLSMDCLGIAADVAANESCDAEHGALAPVRVLGPAALPDSGSWPPAAEVPCSGPVPDDMVCVPGGLFLMGGDDVLSPLPEYEALPEQLVRLSPFLIDRDEVTVKDFRDVASQLPGRPDLHLTDIDELDWACTYLGDEVPDNDALPVNCLLASLAALACEAMGKRLPTEAEWEHAAGNMRETTYPWGDVDDNLCERARLGRGRTVLVSDIGIESTACRNVDTSYGVTAGGHDADITELGIRNMAGNVREWVADHFIPYGDDACWPSSPKLHVDPRCDTASPDLHSLRGGSYAADPNSARGLHRSAGTLDGKLFDTGLRCAKSL